MAKIAKLKKALNFLQEGEGIYLENDIFLTGKELDGSDKVYGFIKTKDNLLVVTREASDGYPVVDMDKEDLNYIFNLSAPNIFNKINNKEYEIVDSKEV